MRRQKRMNEAHKTEYMKEKMDNINRRRMHRRRKL